MLASPAPHPDGSVSFSRRPSERSSTGKRPTSSGQTHLTSLPPTPHSPSMLGFHMSPSTNIKRPSSRDSSNAASIGGSGSEGLRAVGGLLLDQDGEMHDPSYTQSFETLRRQLQREAASRHTQPHLMHWRNSFRPPHHAEDDDDDGDSSWDEEYVSRHVRESINRRRNQSVPHTTTNGTADSAFTAASSESEPRDHHNPQSLRSSVPRRPGSAGAASVPSSGQPFSTATKVGSRIHTLGQTDANSSMEMLDETLPRSPTKSKAKRKGSSSSVCRLRTSSRSRAGSASSAPKNKKTYEVSSLDDWQGSFTGIVDLQREERSRRSSQDAVSSASAVSLVSGPSTRPASPTDRRRGSDGAIGASLQQSAGIQDGRAGKSGMRGLSSKKSSFSKRKLSDSIPPRNRSASMGEDHREGGYAEHDADVTVTQPSRGSSKGRSPSSLFVGTKDLSSYQGPSSTGGSSKRTSPSMVAQDLPLLTPLDENGGYRDYWQSMYAAEQDAEAEADESPSQGMTRSQSQRSNASSAPSVDGSPDVLQAMRRKMQSVSLGVKFKALQAERKFKKTFSGNTSSSTNSGAASAGGYGPSHRVTA